MVSSRESKDGRVTIQVDQQFDYAVHTAFRDAYRNHTIPKTAFVVDLSKTQFMDSSALGMILLLREHANTHEGSVVITQPTDSVYKVLEIAQFQKLIDIQR